MDEALAIDGRVAIVTGAGNGLGRAESLALARAGARLVLNDLPGDAVQAVADEIAADGGQAVVAAGDVAEWPTGETLLATATDAFGRLDVLVNNAGVLKFASIAEMPLDDFRRILEVNAVGCWLGMKAVIEPMKAAGGGSIVNISSIEGFTGAAGLSAYSASKFAVRGMTKVAAQELAPFGIRVNSVHPGGVLTRMTLEQAGTSEHVDGDAFLRSLPLARFAEPVEISRLVAFLASDESSYSTGSEFIADGGILSGPGYY